MNEHMQDKVYKIGSRDSPLAMWQAQKVQSLLGSVGLKTEIIAVKSEGDLDLITPIYAMGVQGVFTKTLDAHLLSGYIDIAVHSMKDVPVQLAEGIIQAAVPKRAATTDVIVWKDEKLPMDSLVNQKSIIGTGSVRRSSFWKHKFPNHTVENLRGNVQTRLRKLQESNWIGAIFARAGLERMEFEDLPITELDWMVSAPAQGALMVVCRSSDQELKSRIASINDEDTERCVYEERAFLSTLHGGCSTPIGALARITDDVLSFQGCIGSIDGQRVMEIEKQVSIHISEGIGVASAKELLDQGADRIVDEIRQLNQ